MLKATLLDVSSLYKEIVGSLIHLMSCTRPDIAYVVTKLSQYMYNITNVKNSRAMHGIPLSLQGQGQGQGRCTR